MKIQLDQAEIEEAVRGYVRRMGIQANVDSITFSQSRKPAGITADVDISDVETPGPAGAPIGAVPVETLEIRDQTISAPPGQFHTEYCHGQLSNSPEETQLQTQVSEASNDEVKEDGAESAGESQKDGTTEAPPFSDEEEAESGNAQDGKKSLFG